MKMKRYPIGFIALAVLIGPLLRGVPGKNSATEDKQVIAARCTRSAPVIDGVMMPGEWRDAVPVRVYFEQPFAEPGVIPLDRKGDGIPLYPPPENRDDLSFSVYALYDEENLYILVDVTDQIVFADNSGIGLPPDYVLDDPAVDGFVKWAGTGHTFDELDWGLLYFEPLAPEKARQSAAPAAAYSIWTRVKVR
jgi:hypothetical protein